MSKLKFEAEDESYMLVAEPNCDDYPEFENETVVILEAYDSAENLNPFHLELDETDTEALIAYLQVQLQEYQRFKMSR